MSSLVTRRTVGAGMLATPLFLGGASAFAAGAGAESTIHRFDQKVPFPVNAYLVEGADGVVIVDATLTVSSSTELRRRADALGKPMRGVLLTHPHPDHYAGLGVLVAGLDVPIVALSGVDDIVRRDDTLKADTVGPMFGDEWPKQRVFPSRRVADGERLDFGKGLAFRAVDIGPAESFHDSIFILDGERPAAFIGDLIYDLMHPYMADGQNDAWRKAIERLQSEFAEQTVLFVGHGAPTTPGLFAWQRIYLDKFEAAIRAADWRDLPRAKEAVATAMKDYLPNDDLLFLMQLSIEPTARRLGVL